MPYLQYARRIRVGLIAILTLAACGGGGGGDSTNAIAPFWTSSGVVVTDLDGDGRADVAVARAYVSGAPPHAGYVSVSLQSTPGQFSAPVLYAIGPDPWGLSVGDFDGDGLSDLVAATPSTVAPQPGTITDSGEVSILRQDTVQRGRFAPAQRVSTGGAAYGAAIARLTGDQYDDLIVADGVLVNGRALLLAQNAAQPGTLLAPLSLLAGAGHGSQDVAVGDLNGDGRADIVLAAYDRVAVFYQSAAGGFEPVLLLTAGLRPEGVAIADIDGDGRLDIAVANAGNAPAGGTGGASVTLLLQLIAGTFSATNTPIADGARRVAIADLNGDGLPDLAVISLVYQDLATPSRVSVLLQSTINRGQFSAASVYGGPSSGNFIAIGDLNADGLNDIVINDGPVVMLQRSTAPGTFDGPRAIAQ